MILYVHKVFRCNASFNHCLPTCAPKCSHPPPRAPMQSGDDVRHIRSVLDEAGGHNVRIISKIENEAGMENYDDILAESDGIMVARGDLGMEIPVAKVPVAQKLMITKASIAGKFVICAT